MNVIKNLVSTESFGIKGINYYWVRKDLFGFTKDELKSVGVLNNLAYVHSDIIESLAFAQRTLQLAGFELLVKDAYRSPELYKMIVEKRSKQFGVEETVRLFNLVDMPHATGLAVDVNLISLETTEEVDLRDKTVSDKAYFVNYYKTSLHPKAGLYQSLQDTLARAMHNAGFKYGKKLEYWHFDYSI